MHGYITRLVDVTLIILVGFLAVADLDERSALPLPVALEAALDSLVDGAAQRSVKITVLEAQRFQLELTSSTGLNLPLGQVSGADTLRSVLARLKDEHGLAGAEVEALPRAPIQSAVDALDACDLVEIPRDVKFRLSAGSDSAAPPQTEVAP